MILRFSEKHFNTGQMISQPDYLSFLTMIKVFFDPQKLLKKNKKAPGISFVNTRTLLKFINNRAFPLPK
jgi:hypothetical protein